MAEIASPPPGIVEGKKYRFVAKSAEEAVRVIRERMGARAKVVSVKQIEGKGLARFLSAPQLEVIASVPVANKEELASTPASGTSKKPESASTEPQRARAPVASTVDAAGSPEPEAEERPNSETYRRKGRASLFQADPGGAPRDVMAILQSSGLPASLLAGLDSPNRRTRLNDLSMLEAFDEVVRRLSEQYREREPRKIGERIAFFGTPGVGKTTALCKRLAHDVFVAQRHVRVVRIETDQPHTSDALGLYCEVLGVPVARDRVEQSWIDDAEAIYFDIPGLGAAQSAETLQLSERLDYFQADTRVLVAHAGYERSLLDRALQLGERLRASHLVLTHLDETPQIARLWPLLLQENLTPWFLSMGQSLAGEFDEDVFDYFCRRTFPGRLAA